MGGGGGGGDAARMLAVGLVWGATNAAMRRGALVWDRKLRRRRSAAAAADADDGNSGGGLLSLLLGAARRWIELLITWQYSAPLLLNLSASAAFFHLLGGAPISVAVPVTNATTFAATAAAAAVLGEEVRLAPAALGTALIVLGRLDVYDDLVSTAV
ncbi:Transmembrane protein 2 [Ananas comosus]|uniref:Transmembrane protein 2 n=1 Tax=Ananas comosus TaxID=4615 RepID=A0A199VQ09_ANACO|nr:Transmembrane protein 2 [Ananas comosus]